MIVIGRTSGVIGTQLRDQRLAPGSQLVRTTIAGILHRSMQQPACAGHAHFAARVCRMRNLGR